MAGLPLFVGLEPACVDRLLGGAAIQRAAAGTILFCEGDEAKLIHVLMSGMVEVSKMQGRRECGVLMFTSGDIFMPAAAMFQEPYLTSGRVLASSRLLTIKGSVLREEANVNPQVAMRMCQLISGQWRMAVRHILDLKCRSAPERLGAFLLRIVDESPNSDNAELPIPKRHLATRVGMTAETLSRTFQILAENGLHVRGSRILVKDRAKIEKFCGPDPYPDRTETSLGVNAL
ncbi:MAG: helix-turn-helix domain-containing protein [Allosphingosinicella sp.]